MSALLREIPNVTAPTLPILLDAAGEYLPGESIDQIERAYHFADTAHNGELRLSGEPYIVHPLATAYYLATMQLDASTVIAGLLHDVIEDTDVTSEEVEAQFGSTVCRLVDGVTKFAEIGQRHREWQDYHAETEVKQREEHARHQAENLRKMFLAMAEDPRVVIVKLADRLHNMRTLDAVRPDKQRRIARDTREIYAPLAGRLGIAQMKWPLEDLAFKYLEPDNYWWLVQQVAEQRAARQAFVDSMATALISELAEHGIKAEVTGRPKHLYSIFKKLLRPDVNMDVTRVFDLFAVRVLVENEAQCYQVLGMVHALWPPVPGRVKDYIAVPKPNGYQSLHTSVVAGDGRTVEVQIRTHRMHEVAEFGLATHWFYKEHGQSAPLPGTLTNWVKSLMNWQQELGHDATEFVDTLKVDLFGDEVFVFTPKGDILDLPAGSTPIDFAYRIHTDVGNRCIGAKVNGIMVPLSHQLSTGDRVEILTTRTAHGPGREWLTFVKSANARHKIRQWFKKENRDENISRGRELLDRELQRLDQRSLAEVNLDVLAQVAHQLDYKTLDDLFAAIGYGAVGPYAVVRRLGFGDQREEPVIPTEAPVMPMPSGDVRVMGAGNLLTRMAACCHPAPGDAIIGYITRNRGVTVHRLDCPRIQSEQERERLVEVEWGHQPGQQQFPIPVVIEGWDRDGLLRDITTAIMEERVGLSAASATTNADGTALIHVTVRITSIDQLARIFTLIEGIPGVRSVHRDGRRRRTDGDDVATA